MGLKEFFGLSTPGPAIPQVDLNGPIAPPDKAMKPADAASLRLYQSAYPAIVKVETDQGSGSGFFVDRQGHVVTSAHVVIDARKVSVVTSDGVRHPARIEALSDTTDLAELTVTNLDADKQKYLELADSSQLKRRQSLSVVGHPLGYDQTYLSRGSFGNKVRALDLVNDSKTASKLLSLSEEQRSDVREALNTTLIEGTLHIEPGNSGSPLLDDAGKVVGVAAMVGTPHSRSYYRPVEEIKDLLDKSRSKFEFVYDGRKTVARTLAGGANNPVLVCGTAPIRPCASDELPPLTITGADAPDELIAMRRKDGSFRPAFKWTQLDF